MKGLYQEISEIPGRTRACYEANHDLKLPTGVPYIGMGSSYYAALTIYYCGANIQPQIASEYYYYLADSKLPQAVLISQSGESSETVWNIDNFEHVTSITANPSSTLATASNVSQVVKLHSGAEAYSSTKSYVNTLLSLYMGLGIDPLPAVEALEQRFSEFETLARQQAKQIAQYLNSVAVRGLHIIGSGPNHGTALEAALTLSETTKLSWLGTPVAQYDHGPKETADSSIVIILNAHGKDGRRIEALKQTLLTSTALVMEVNESALGEILSPFTLIAQLNLMMNFLADEMVVGDTFKLGGKVTRVDDSIR